MSAISIAASGLRDASVRLDVAANNIANVNTAGFTPSRVDSVETAGGGVAPVVVLFGPNPLSDLPPGTNPATELVALVLSRAAFQSNIGVLKSAIESQRALLELLA